MHSPKAITGVLGLFIAAVSLYAVFSPHKVETAPMRNDLSGSRNSFYGPSVSGNNANVRTTVQQPELNDDFGWNPGNHASLGDPDNWRGKPPNTTEGNNNFQISAPLLSLPGRGLDLNLNLIYNSLVWNKSGNEILFNIDHDYPAPGWQLGFGKMVAMGTAGALLIEPDGARHGFTGTVFDYVYTNVTPPRHVLTFKGRTTDGSLIEYRCEMGAFPQGVARYPNGMVVYYANYSEDAINPHNYAYPYAITDSNGNTIRIKYAEPWDQAEPRIERIIDTAGRVIAFHYDTQKRLTAITGPGLPDVNGNSTTRTFVRLHYTTQTLNLTGAFSNLTPRVQNASFAAIDAIYYPGTSTGYWFGANDSYSSYGMLKKVVEQRGMGFLPGANFNEQGTITQGTLTRQQIYDYPSSPSALTAAPTYGTITESWASGVSNVTTTVVIQTNPGLSERTVTITRPNAAKTIQKSFKFSDPNQFKNGLVKEDQTLDANGNLVQKTTFEWEAGSDSAPRLQRTETTDERGQVLATDYDMYGTNNSVGRMREYDYDGSTVIRTTVNTFLSYLDNDLDQGIDPLFGLRVVHPRLVNLPASVSIYDGDDAANKLASYQENEYDVYAATLQAYGSDCDGNLDLFSYGQFQHNNGQAIGILSHSASFNPLPPSCQGGSGAQYFTMRGNLTSVKRYADTTDPGRPANPITETRTYDMAGNVIAASRACCEQMSSVYELPAQYAFSSSQTSGSADSNSLMRFTTSATHDLKTGLQLSKTDANGRQTTMTYFSDSLRPKEVISPTGARTNFDYDVVAMNLTQTTRVSLNGAIAGKTTKYLNGLGQVIREEALDANNVTDIVETIYDQFGRLFRQSRPYRNGENPQWKETIYDAAGRVSETREPYVDQLDLQLNGTITRYFYNEASRPPGASGEPGQTTRIVDPWGRSRWTRLDASGQLAEVVEPNPDPAGGNGFVTRYSYNPLEKLVKVLQGVQERRFQYDSLGRLTHQKLAEADATLNSAGELRSGSSVVDPFGWIDSGSDKEMWSDVFTYDERSKIISHTDARGVKTLFSYQDPSGQDDPLNRLQSVTYDTSGVNSATVLPAASVSYQYRTKLSAADLVDISQVKQMVAAGVSTEDYDYDVEGRLQEKRFTFAGRSQPMTITYAYDALSRVSQMTYPEQYQGNITNPVRKIVNPSYDVASRMAGLKVNNVDYASQINYNAASQIDSISIGTGANQLLETYQYDPKSGLLTNQSVQRNGNQLKNLSYWYRKDPPCPPGSNCPAVDHSTAYTGQVTTVFDSGKYNFYAYDALGRLRHVKQWAGKTTYSLKWTQDYSYDRYGNRTATASSGNSGGVPIPRDGYQSLEYDPSTNRITSPGFSYDAAGNQVTNGTGQSFIYDAAGRLVKVKDQNGTTVATYTYGASNQRLITQTGNESSTARTYYLWQGGAVITEYVEPTNPTSSMPQWSRNYIYLGSRLLATEESNGVAEIVRYHHPDRLGTRLVTNNIDTTFFEQVTLPFGTALDAESTGSTNRRFTSYDRSATSGLDYAVNRYYDPRQGRFTQVDPLGMGAANLADPQSLNMYSYVGNDPMNRVDPDGQFWGALFRFIAGLFRSLRPNIINGSFTYHNQPPISVSFTTNFQNIGVGYGAYGIPLRIEGQWLPALLNPRNDPFGEALNAARGILSGDNECSKFFGGAGLSALNGIADAVSAAGNKAYTVLDNVNIGISMNIPFIVAAARAPLVTAGLYGYISPNSVAINSRGAFGLQASFGTLPRFGGYAPGSLQSRVLQLFHETGHLVITDVGRTLFVVGKGKKARVVSDMYRLTHLLPLDGGDTNLSERNTERVLRACRTEIDALRN